MGESPTWVGAAMVSWVWHVTRPLAQLTLGSDAVVVEPSAHWLRWLFPRKEIRWRDLNKVVGIRNGVRFYIRGEGGSTSFFLGGDRETILDQIEAHGVTVERGDHPSGWWWGGD